MREFLNGALMMGFSIVALFFLRFWVRTRDKLFAIFAISFFILASERIFLGLLQSPSEVRTWVYLLRLTAFLLIIWGVVQKNRENGV